MRKHHTDMTVEEKVYIDKLIIQGQYSISDHCRERMATRNISDWEILNGVANGCVVEVRSSENQVRVMLKDTKRGKRGEVNCVVIDPIDRVVVTTYRVRTGIRVNKAKKGYEDYNVKTTIRKLIKKRKKEQKVVAIA